MLCLSGFELYSRWVPLTEVTFHTITRYESRLACQHLIQIGLITNYVRN